MMTPELLNLQQLHKRYGANTILSGVTFCLNRGERAALIGENGVGKTTLARLIVGQDAPDSGTVRFAPGARLGYLPQVPPSAPGLSIHEFIADQSDDLHRLGQDLHALEDRLAGALAPDALTAVLEAYALLQAEYEARGGYTLESRLHQLLVGLALSHLDLNQAFERCSGGEKTRLGLAALLLRQPDLLILDEPTNHLDFAGMDWLAGYLRGYKGALLLLTHDRDFIDHVATHIIELSAQTRSTRSYFGSYADYLIQREREQAQALAAYEAQTEELHTLRRAVKTTTHNTRTSYEPIGDKFLRYKMEQTAQATRSAKIRDAKQRISTLEEERLDNPRHLHRIAFAFAPAVLFASEPLRMDGLSKQLGGRTLFHDLNATLRRGERVALVAPNGAGKTTLLRCLAGLLPPDAGRVLLAPSVRLGYLGQEGEGLDERLLVFDAYRQAAPASSDREVQAALHRAGIFTDANMPFKRVGELSVGQRRKLALACVLAQQANVLLLDEPTNHVDLLSVEALEEALQGFQGALIAATHDRRFISKVATQVWRLEAGQLIITA